MSWFTLGVVIGVFIGAIAGYLLAAILLTFNKEYD